MTSKRQKRWVENPTVLTVDFERARANRERQQAEAEKKARRREKLKRKRERKKERVAAAPKPISQKKAMKVTSDAFLESFEWRQLRYKAIKKYGRQCQCCGRKPPEISINVDHIKPRRKFPELALDINNLQVLCHDCNHGKGNWDQTDWRKQGAGQ